MESISGIYLIYYLFTNLKAQNFFKKEKNWKILEGKHLKESEKSSHLTLEINMKQMKA